MGRINF